MIHIRKGFDYRKRHFDCHLLYKLLRVESQKRHLFYFISTVENKNLVYFTVILKVITRLSINNTEIRVAIENIFNGLSLSIL